MQNRLFEIFKEEQKNGCTVFLSSHNLSEVERHCDRVGIIRDGSMLEVADVDKVALEQTVMVTLLTKQGEKKQFAFQSDMNELVTMLKEYDLSKLEVRKASLEDSFLKFYGEENGNEHI